MKPTRIIRAPHDTDYFISTRYAPQDRALSWEARGILWYLLSKPNDWTVQPKDLEQGCGHGKVYKLLKELRAARYLKLIEERDERKHITGYIYEVHETPYEAVQEKNKSASEQLPTEKPLAEKQHAGKQQAVNRHLREYRDIQNTEGTEKEKEKSTSTVASVPVPATQEALKLEVDRMVNGVVAKMNGNMGITRKTDAQIAEEFERAYAKHPNQRRS
jgi:hypothetical protein